jgi:AraC-like DNA-binding protein
MISVILTVYTKGQNLANKYVAFSALLAGFYSFYMLSISLGYIKYYFWLFGWAVPIEYLLSPSIYIFIRHYLYNDNTFKKYDLLFLVPMLIQLFEMFPFLISDNETKLLAYEKLMSGNSFVIPNGRTIFPPELHLVFKFLEHIILLIILWVKIIRFDKTLKSINFYKHPSMKAWIRMNTTILTILCIAPIIIVLNVNGFSEFIKLYSIVLPLSVFLMDCSFFFKPWVLYDLPTYYTIQEQIPTLEISTSNTQTVLNSDDYFQEYEIENATFTLDDDTLQQYESTLFQVLDTQKNYLKHGYSSGDLAQDCNIPKHHLSYLLNKKLSVRYNDFINKLRIEYAQTLMQQENAYQLTIDAIAVKSGFSSRSTFIKYFQKHVGKNPSDYLRAYKI